MPKTASKKTASASPTTATAESKKANGRLSTKPLERVYFVDKQWNIDLPDLIEVQTDSYRWFLDEGIRELLEEITPITDFSGRKLELHFLDHSLGECKYTPEQCRSKNLSFEAPLKVHVQLINKESGEIKEQDVFLGPIPLMTEDGSFIVNGIERVVVSQIVRSPGVFFAKNTTAPGMNNAKIIPKRGAWLEIETDKKGVITVKIDRKRKIYVTSMLRVFGFDTDKKILDLFKAEKGLVNEDGTDVIHDSMLLTLEKDPAKTMDEAYKAIYKKIRPGDLATPENAKALIESLFFDYKKYDMGSVARYKINRRFDLKTPNERKFHTFQIDDFILILKHLLKLNRHEAEADDIDHLSNRRIRPVGELVQNKFRVGLLRTERIAKDRMTVMDLDTVTPTQLVNSRPITAALREFYASSQLSQFMDQTNPLSELEHKRRLSAMGPGGLSRERASFDVRDVHPSHYGRICPIATPEGPNIGLVVHLATQARLNKYGFIEMPLREVSHSVKNDGKAAIGHHLIETIDGIKAGTLMTEKEAKALAKVKDLKEVPVKAKLGSTISYFDAEDEKEIIYAQAGTPINEQGEITEDTAIARQNGEPVRTPEKDVTHIDISPQQIISVSTSLIPFLEHDDNTRASMGSNMQRQAVPLLKPQTPVVGTGMEADAARNTAQAVVAAENGTISYVDGSRIDIIYESGRKVTYNLDVYRRTNQGTCFHQRPRCEMGEKVKKGDVLIDGASTEMGELGLGQNVLVAYLPWEGYNFEDAVILSSRLVKDDRFSSIHIEDFTVDVRDTKLGAEIVTRDIPNVGEARLKDLDENGIVHVGASVREGDILVGKITPKGETELTPEERLLRAIFGDKARDVKDTSLRLPGGEGGKVVSVTIFSRESGDELENGVIQQIRVSVAQTRRIQVGDKVAGRHGNKGVISIIVPEEDMPFMPDGTPVDVVLNPLGVSSRMNIGQILETHLGWAAQTLGLYMATPALNGITNEQIKDMLKKAGLPENGKLQLFDGKTGEPFDHESTVGITYILKLAHLVEDKIHARSVGPYSLVTQQPLGGKAQHGGQRFGEMEVWALEAYGASHILQEMLTIKSDDVYGRAKAYESIIKGESIRKPRTPESFNVLVKELQSLCLNVDLMQITEDENVNPEEEYVEPELEEEAIVDKTIVEDLESEGALDEEDLEALGEEALDPELDEDSETKEDKEVEEEI